MHKSIWRETKAGVIATLGTSPFMIDKPIQHSNFIPVNMAELSRILEERVETTLRNSIIGREEENRRLIVHLLQEIKNQLYEINKELKTLKVPFKEEIVVFRELTKEEAKKEIKKYFSTHKDTNISYSDLVQDLNLDLKLIVEICSELEKEGLIG